MKDLEEGTKLSERSSRIFLVREWAWVIRNSHCASSKICILEQRTLSAHFAFLSLHCGYMVEHVTPLTRTMGH